MNIAEKLGEKDVKELDTYHLDVYLENVADGDKIQNWNAALACIGTCMKKLTLYTLIIMADLTTNFIVSQISLLHRLSSLLCFVHKLGVRRSKL